MTKVTGPIKKLQIQNFKSLKNIDIAPGRVNVFIGKPNAGKTNLLEALTLLGMDFNGKNQLPKNNIRYTDIGSLFYDQNYDESIIILTDEKAASMMKSGEDAFYWNATQDSSKFDSISKVEILNEISIEDLLGGLKKHITFHNSGKIHSGELEKDKKNIKRYQFYNSSDSHNLVIDGNSIWTIIKHNSYLKSFTKDFFKEFSLEVLYDRDNKMSIMRKSEDSYYLIDFSMTPDTFQRMLYYLAVIEANKNSVILLEEPESQSYPPYIQMLAEKIVEDKHNQYFITTHSPFIVEKMLQKAGANGDVKIFVTYFEDYQTKVHELTAAEIGYIIDNSVDLFFNIESFQK